MHVPVEVGDINSILWRHGRQTRKHSATKRKGASTCQGTPWVGNVLVEEGKENALLGNILLIYGCVDKRNTYLIWDGNIMVQGVH